MTPGIYVLITNHLGRNLVSLIDWSPPWSSINFDIDRNSRLY